MGDAANAFPSTPTADSYTVVAFVSISAFSSMGLVYLIFDFFKRRRGLYFWSLLIASVGTIIACAFCLLFIFGNADTLLPSSIGVVLSYTTISVSNSLVLYSRVHLVTGGRKPRWILYMIIGSVLLLQFPHVITVPAAAAVHGRGNWTQAVMILEKISVVGYCLREMIILGFYAWATIRNLRPLIFLRGRQGRKLIIALIFAGGVSFALDTANMVVDFTVASAVVAAFVPFIISTKLLVEFAALNKLIRLVHSDSDGEYHNSNSTGDNSDHRHVHTRHQAFHYNQTLTSPDSVVLETKRSRSSDQNSSPPNTNHRTYTNDLPSIDASDSVELATPPRVHSAEHLVHEIPDLEAGPRKREVSASEI